MPWGPYDRPPNFLVLMTDQQRQVQHWPQGWAERNLPTITRLARTGVRFANGMTNTTACSPSRATLFTGTYPGVHGVDSVGATLQPQHANPLGTDLVTMGQALTQLGYDVAYKGKWHLVADFDSFSTVRPVDAEEQDADDQTMSRVYGMPGWNGPDAGTALSFSDKPVDPGGDSALNTLGGGDARNDARYVEGPNATPSQETAVEWLRAAPTDRPWALVVSLVNPHDIFVCPWSLETAGFDPSVLDRPEYARFRLPPSYSADATTLPSAAQWWLTNFQGGPLTEDQAKQYIRFYAYLHTLTDGLHGRVLEALEALGPEVVENTVIVRLADHGEMSMSQAGMREKEYSCYDEVLKVPVIFSNPRLPQGAVSDDFFGLVDVMPTLLEMAGADASEYPLQGQSMAASVLDPDRDGQRSLLFGSNDVDEDIAGYSRCLVTHGWKYVVWYSADGVDAPTDPNGTLDPSTLEYQLFERSTEAGRLETDNLLADPSSVDDRIRAVWTTLHARLTAKVDATFMAPADWPTTPPPLDNSSS